MSDFVSKIVTDPKNPPATLMLTGYLGASSEEKHTRLYFDAHLSSYAEIPDDAILHQQDAKSDDGLGATLVWIARDAQLIYGPAAQQRPRGAFLDGPIMQDHMARTIAAGNPQVAFPVTRVETACGVTVSPAGCYPSVLHLCVTQLTHCNFRTLTAPCLPVTLPQCVPFTLNAGFPMQQAMQTGDNPQCLGNTSANQFCSNTLDDVRCPSALCTGFCFTAQCPTRDQCPTTDQCPTNDCPPVDPNLQRANMMRMYPTQRGYCR